MLRGRSRKPTKQWPPWLVGLILAVVVSVIALLLMNALGYGDDPSVGAMARR